MRYDAAIVGGGLGGLAAAIQLANLGRKVVLFEKNQYPFMRVCGEYISMESWPFLESLGLDLDLFNLPIFNQLLVTSPSGTAIEHQNWLGGFGISRYFLDFELSKIAKMKGVVFYENTKVEHVIFKENYFQIETNSDTFESIVCIGSFGKRSNLDLKWKRPFIQEKSKRLTNFIGVKYHIKIDKPLNQIALHNFKDGYCGISAIEDNKFCLCYLTTAQNLKNAGNDIKSMETSILSVNPVLKSIFENAQFVDNKPIVISQISFESKELVHDHVLFVGDAAGMITPLCGNGMSMALHGSKILVGLVEDFFQNIIDRKNLENLYQSKWNKQFQTRVKVGRFIQSNFGNEKKTELLIRFLKPFPNFLKKLVGLTHGKVF